MGMCGKTRGGVTTAGRNDTMRENNYEMKDSRKTWIGIHANTLRTYGLDKGYAAMTQPFFMVDVNSSNRASAGSCNQVLSSPGSCILNDGSGEDCCPD